MIFICPCCGTEGSIKDNDRFSSLLCNKRIVIYYYETGQSISITKGEYLDYKKKKRYEQDVKGQEKER